MNLVRKSIILVFSSMFLLSFQQVLISKQRMILQRCARTALITRGPICNDKHQPFQTRTHTHANAHTHFRVFRKSRVANMSPCYRVEQHRKDIQNLSSHKTNTLYKRVDHTMRKFNSYSKKNSYKRYSCRMYWC